MKNNLILLAICILCFCGCSKKEEYEDFKHYDLLDNDTTSMSYSFYDDDKHLSLIHI